MDSMLAAVLEEFHKPLELRNLPIPEPDEGEVRLRVLASGLCSTDNHIIEGKINTVVPPRIPGHEIVGEIEKVGSNVNGLSLGSRCVARIDVVCKECIYCRSGRENLCLNRERIGFERNGGHAQYVVVPAVNIVPISDKIDPIKAAIIPDAVACMLHCIVDQGQVKKGDRVVLIGLGGLAYQGVQIVKKIEAEAIGTSRQQHKRDLAVQLGAVGSCNSTEDDIRKCAQDTWGDDIIDVVFDNVGTAATLELSLSLVKRGGKVVVVGYEVHSAPFNVYDLMLNEKEIIGARGSSLENLIESVKWVEDGTIEPLVTNTYPLKDINTALDDLANGRIVGRAVIDMGSN